jgi:hypothetical protein
MTAAVCCVSSVSRVSADADPCMTGPSSSSGKGIASTQRDGANPMHLDGDLRKDVVAGWRAHRPDRQP